MADNFQFHEDFQKLILAYLARVTGALATYELVMSPVYFESTTNGTLYSYYADYYKKHKKTPSREVVLDLIHQGFIEKTDDSERKRKGCEQRLEEILEMDISDAKYIDQRLREFLRWSAMKDFIYTAYEGLAKNEFDLDLPKKARLALAKGEESFSTGLEWRDNVYPRISEDSRDNASSRVPTGVFHLDQQIGGGLRGGELGIILAVPKGFKSGTMLNFAYGAMRKDLYATDNNNICTNVAYFTLELSERLVASRFDRRCSLMPREELMRDHEAYSQRLSRMMNSVCGDSRLFIKGYKSKQATCDTFRAYLDRMWDEHGIKFGEIIVDYLDITKSTETKHRKESWEDAALICEDLRDIAIEYNVPVWTACRATKEAVGKETISMNMMSKSFERVGVADLMIAVCQTGEEMAHGKLRLALVAARNDASDKQVDCEVNYPLMKLTSTGVSQIKYEEDLKRTRQRKTDEAMLNKLKTMKAAKKDDIDE